MRYTPRFEQYTGKTLFFHRFARNTFALFDRFGVICNASQRDETYRHTTRRIVMPVLIEATRYFSAIEIAKELGVSRSTFWRWRSQGEIPCGRRYRGGKMVLFTEEEFAAIREFANRLEPVQVPNRHQLKLFNGVR
jgi:predicted DNA-binding transcriptional regulator AlpA